MTTLKQYKKQVKYSKRVRLGARIGIVICVIAILVSGGAIYKRYRGLKHSEDQFQELREQISAERVQVTPAKEETINEGGTTSVALEGEIPKEVLPKYRTLYEQNHHFAGWIKVEGTNLDYPVMQTSWEEDPGLYIHRDFNGAYSASGLPFIDVTCEIGESQNLIIYSHHMQNGSMFGFLTKYKDKSFLEEHPVISFDTLYDEGEYEIISVFLSKMYYDGDAPEGAFEYYNYGEPMDKEQFDEYVRKVKEDSLYDTGKTAFYGDELITLSTCEYHTKDGRLVIVARDRKSVV